MIAGGRIPGTRAKEAFVLRHQSPSPIPILIAVPHAGRSYPADLLQIMRQPEQATLRLEDRLIDLVAETVAAETGAHLLVANAPRAMIDLNRATEDMDWDMVAGGPPATVPRHAAGHRSRSGLGLVPRRLPGQGELWRRRLSPGELAERIEQVHAPYHRQLGRSLEALREQWGSALLIDLHSMPPLGPKHGRNRAADFVLGDRFGASCDPSLVHAALDHFSMAGQLAAHNRPYAGGYVLDRHGAPRRGHNAMQIEVCRTAYLDSQLCDTAPGMAVVVEVLSGLVRILADELIGRSDGLAQAAE